MTQTVPTEIPLSRNGGGPPAPDLAAAADAIVRAGLWCVVETRTGGDPAGWDPRLLICRKDVAAIATAVAGWRLICPDEQARIAGYTRDTLRRVDAAPTAPCGP